MIAIDITYIMLIPESRTVTALVNSNSTTSRITESQSHATLVPVNDSDEPHKTVVVQESRLERLKKSLLPEQLPGRLGGKHSILLLMITCFLALLAVMGKTLDSVFLSSNQNPCCLSLFLSDGFAPLNFEPFHQPTLFISCVHLCIFPASHSHQARDIRSRTISCSGSNGRPLS